jgi:hypothetical protein
MEFDVEVPVSTIPSSEVDTRKNKTAAFEVNSNMIYYSVVGHG